MINGGNSISQAAVLLRKHETRLLHSGDEICLVNAATLQKKIRNTKELQDLLQTHSYVFVKTNTTATAVPSASNNKRKTAVDVMGTTTITTNATSLSSLSLLGQQQQPPQQQGSNNRRRIEQDYDIRNIIGSGTVGQVRRAIHRQTGQEYAVKIIHYRKNGCSHNAAATELQIQAESAILRQLEHPYIVKLYDVYLSEGVNTHSRNATASTVYLVMELVPGGDLFDHVVSQESGRYGEIQARRVMRRLLAAVHYLHETCNIVHRDLKLENILCCRSDDSSTVKLTDFGLAKTVGQDGLKTFCGTPQYFAPEVLKRQHTVAGRGRYGKSADCWSLGVILYILLTGTMPFDEDTKDAGGARECVVFPEEQDDAAAVSVAAQDLVRQLLRRDPRQRLTVAEACQHPWILTEDGDTHIHPLQDPKLQQSMQQQQAVVASNDGAVAKKIKGYSAAADETNSGDGDKNYGVPQKNAAPVDHDDDDDSSTKLIVEESAGATLREKECATRINVSEQQVAPSCSAVACDDDKALPSVCLQRHLQPRMNHSNSKIERHQRPRTQASSHLCDGFLLSATSSGHSGCYQSQLVAVIEVANKSSELKSSSTMRPMESPVTGSAEWYYFHGASPSYSETPLFQLHKLLGSAIGISETDSAASNASEKRATMDGTAVMAITPGTSNAHVSELAGALKLKSSSANALLLQQVQNWVMMSYCPDSAKNWIVFHRLAPPQSCWLSKTKVYLSVKIPSLPLPRDLPRNNSKDEKFCTDQNNRKVSRHQHWIQKVRRIFCKNTSTSKTKKQQKATGVKATAVGSKQTMLKNWFTKKHDD